GGVPLPGVTVQIVGGQFGFTLIATLTTDASGNYTASNLANGTYYAKTTNSQGFIDQCYIGVPCNLSADATNGTSFTVTAPNTTSGINFALSAGGRISGTITNGSPTMQPGSTVPGLPNVNVLVYKTSTTPVGCCTAAFATTD